MLKDRIYPSNILTVFLSFVVASIYVTSVQAALPEFTKVVDKYGPAVVNISTTQKIARNGGFPHGRMPFPEGTPFDDFFRRFFDEDRDGCEPVGIHQMR